MARTRTLVRLLSWKSGRAFLPWHAAYPGDPFVTLCGKSPLKGMLTNTRKGSSGEVECLTCKARLARDEEIA